MTTKAAGQSPVVPVLRGVGPRLFDDPDLEGIALKQEVGELTSLRFLAIE